MGVSRILIPLELDFHILVKIYLKMTGRNCYLTIGISASSKCSLIIFLASPCHTGIQACNVLRGLGFCKCGGKIDQRSLDAYSVAVV